MSGIYARTRAVFRPISPRQSKSCGMTKPTGVGRGGRRPGAGRPWAPEMRAMLGDIRRGLGTQNSWLEGLHQDRRDAFEHALMILRRLTELDAWFVVAICLGCPRPADGGR